MKKDEIKARYREMKKDAPNVVRCSACRSLLAKQDAHPHHVNGRHGARLLDFVWVCPQCHTWIHDNPEAAKKIGLYHTMP